MDFRKYGCIILVIGAATPLHEAVVSLPKEVVHILPAIHVLTGCDTICKVGSKLQAFDAAQKSEHFKLKEFGVKDLDDDMFKSAEQFLLDTMSRNANRKVDSFDQLRYDQYHARGSTMSIDKIRCTSSTLMKQQNVYHFTRNSDKILLFRQKSCTPFS